MSKIPATSVALWNKTLLPEVCKQLHKAKAVFRVEWYDTDPGHPCSPKAISGILVHPFLTEKAAMQKVTEAEYAVRNAATKAGVDYKDPDRCVIYILVSEHQDLTPAIMRIIANVKMVNEFSGLDVYATDLPAVATK